MTKKRCEKKRTVKVEMDEELPREIKIMPSRDKSYSQVKEGEKTRV